MSIDFIITLLSSVQTEGQRAPWLPISAEAGISVWPLCLDQPQTAPRGAWDL